MTSLFTVFSAFTTFASGWARWICSPRLSKLLTERPGGLPLAEVERVRDVDQHLAGRFSAPAASSASSEASPFVALRISSAPAAASA